MKNINKKERTEYDYHQPVLLNESINYLFNEKFSGVPNQIYVDGTLGGGGHTAIILQKLKTIGGKVFAFDKDTTAIAWGNNLFEEEIKTPSPSISLHNNSFTKAKDILAEQGIFDVNGIILDLGVSSKQLDSNQCGISYRFDSPIDMRFDAELNPNKPSAKDILNTYPEDKLSAIFFKYGEEPKSKIIAKEITAYRKNKPIETTLELRTIIEKCVRNPIKSPTLSRIFQAIRIEVNNELTELKDALINIIPILKSGGRIVVISYHSLEDRIVKDIFREYSFVPKENKYKIKELPNIISKRVPILKLLISKPYVPSEIEISQNPRSRSAKMRIAEKI
ncbi:MAG: 16S rRNA (cytosine(1402)-N(4))-methyltransferase RsmH [Bacteroidetes bacterium]|nr:16S rRNA (cytosine(1402)-N(4))-methyltransferase RsmH [Bacteroidota bacterium]